MEQPIGVTLISFYYILSAVFLIFTVLFFNTDANEIGLANRFGLVNFPENSFRILIAIFTLFMSYRYFFLTKWGFWLMIIDSTIFGLISVNLFFSNIEEIMFFNIFLRSTIVLVYTLFVRKSFFKYENVRT